MLKTSICLAILFSSAMASADSAVKSQLAGGSRSDTEFEDRSANYDCIAYGLPVQKDDPSGQLHGSGFQYPFKVRAVNAAAAVHRTDQKLRDSFSQDAPTTTYRKSNRDFFDSYLDKGLYDIECKPLEMRGPLLK